MSHTDFEFIRKLLRDHAGIALDSDKQYLVESRLIPVIRENSLASISHLVAQLRDEPSNGLYVRIIEAMVTSETSFFRDVRPFEALRKAVIPELMKQRRAERSLNIWCAASSTGQEPYSLALLLQEHFPELKDWKVNLLASDLSRDVLERARQGRYSQIEVNRGLPASLLIKYFGQQETHWQLSDNIRRMVRFEEINLAKLWPALPKMDLVMMRNVMIYFDVSTKKDILGRLSRVLKAGSFLLLGGAETTLNLDASYRRVEHHKTSFYQLTDSEI